MRRQQTSIGEFFLGLAVGLALNVIIGLPLAIWVGAVLGIPAAFAVGASVSVIAVVAAYASGRPSLAAGLIAAAAIPLLAAGACTALVTGSLG